MIIALTSYRTVHLLYITPMRFIDSFFYILYCKISMNRKSLYGAYIFVIIGVFAISHGANAFYAFSDGTLMQGSGPKVYVLENGMKRWITTEKVFNAFEYNWDKIQTISDGDLAQYPTGRELDSAYEYPEGALIRSDVNQGGNGVRVYIVQRGVRRWVETEQDFVNLGLSWEAVMDISPEKMKTVPEGESLKQETPIARPLAV